MKPLLACVLVAAGSLVFGRVRAEEGLGKYTLDDEGELVEHGRNHSFVDVFFGAMTLSKRWEGSTPGARIGLQRNDFVLSLGIAIAVQGAPRMEDAVVEGYELDTDVVEPAKFWLQAFVGYEAYGDGNVSLFPGIVVMRTDHPAYGSTMGLGVPFVWRLTPHADVRLGLELAIYTAFGGHAVGVCDATGSEECAAGERREEPLPFSVGYGGNVFLGVAFDAH